MTQPPVSFGSLHPSFVDPEEQASIREQAADYTLDGKKVPDELVRRYNQAGSHDG